MSKRTVHEVSRITYSFSQAEIVELLLEDGRDCRGFNLNPGPKVEWGKDGVVLVYEYATEKKEPPPPEGTCGKCGVVCAGAVAQGMHDAGGCALRLRGKPVVTGAR